MKRTTSAALVALALAWPLCGVQAAVGNAGGAHSDHNASTPAHKRVPAAIQAAHRGTAAACRYAKLRPNRGNLRAVAAATVCLIERERARHRLAALRANGELGAIAFKQACDMIAGGYFGDNGRAGQTPLQRVVASRYGWRSHTLALGQDIGWGLGTLSTPEAMVRSWMASAPHRAILLKASYRDVGAGVAAAAPRRGWRSAGATYVLELAARA